VSEAVSPLVHRVLEPRNAGTQALYPAIVLLHGRGADEEDLAGLSPFLDPRFLFLSVRAPYPFDPGGGFTWYNVEMDGTPDPEMFRHSYARLNEFVTHALQSFPIDPGRLFLLGFSMGTMMALALALTSPGLFRGVVANSGYVPEKAGLDLKWSGQSSTSFFIAHGMHDPVIPIALGQRTKSLFEASDASWIYREYPMGHEISPESLTDISEWLKNLI